MKMSYFTDDNRDSRILPIARPSLPGALDHLKMASPAGLRLRTELQSAVQAGAERQAMRYVQKGFAFANAL